MQQSTFAARDSQALQAIRFMPPGETGSRTVGNAVKQFHMPVPALRSLDALVRATQARAYNDSRGKHSPLAWNDVQDSTDDVPDAALKVVRAGLKAQGLPSRGHGATLLAAHEVGFHHDPVFAHTGAFLVWQVAGPRKALDFPQLGLSAYLEPGQAIVFDGATPHGLQLPQFAGRPFDAQGMRQPPASPDEVSVYVSVDMRWSKSLEAAVGVRRTKDDLFMSEFEVDTCTGAVKPT